MVATTSIIGRTAHRKDRIVSAHQIDTGYLQDQLTTLLHVPSPTGFAGPALDVAQAALEALGLEARRTKKGVLVADWAGAASDSNARLDGPRRHVGRYGEGSQRPQAG